MKQGTILGSQIGKWLILVVLVAAFAALLTASVVRAQDDSTIINYAENGKDSVATFTATDPEGVTPITWAIPTGDPDGGDGDLTVDDNEDSASFTIDRMDGVLKFLSPPDYEADTDGGGDTDNDNTYNVVVVACDLDVATPATCTDGERGYHKVTVKVTNVAETGKVTWGVDHDDSPGVDTPTLVQFQVGADLIVAANEGVTDGDVPSSDKFVTERLQWYRSPSKTGMGTAIEDATSATYPVTTEDIGMYLRVEAYYNVGTGREESASLTSDYPVLGSRSNNVAPEFDPATVTREVSEGKKGMTVGAPVRATDDITNALNYTLDGDDAARFEIDQKTGQIKTLVDLDREGETEATAAAIGSCSNAASDDPDPECAVTVIATDSAGSASTAATVTITITNVDEKPTFSTTSPAIGMKMISRAEGMTALAETSDVANVTYMATDPEGLSLTYRLMGDDGAKFSLDSNNVLSFRMKPDYEKPTDRNKDNVYEVTVRASDGAMHTDHMVMVTVMNDDEGPTVMGKDSVNYAENGKDSVATFTATDPEGVTPITWAIPTGDPDGGDGDLTVDDNEDSASFTIDRMDGVLKFLSPPDYEADTDGGGDTDNDNTYNVVVVACDLDVATPATCTDGERGYHKVTVKVTNVAETGKVTWTVDPAGIPDEGILDTDNTPIMQFQVGATLEASATDGDIAGGTKTVTATDHNLTWQWSRGGAVIDNQTNATYTVTTEDFGKRLRVQAFYTVDDGREESASLTSDYPVLRSRSNNEAPEFDPATVTREVSEGKKGMTVGAPVRATDDITNALNYTLDGDDAARFEIDQKTGQIKTLVDLDREGETEATAAAIGSCSNAASDDPDPECAVTVIATDSAGSASTAATVTITITNVDEKPTFSTTSPAIGMKMISRAEGMTALAETSDVANVTYMATDPDDLQVNLTMMGDDEAKFQLTSSDNGGVLSFKEKPDYEKPADRNKDNVYEVTVRASDGTMYADHMVMVTVTDDDEAPMILSPGLSVSGPSSLDYAEKGMDAVGTYTASGSQAASARWTLDGDDAGDFRLSSSSGISTMLMFRSSPNYEVPMDADTDNTYMVTVKAIYGSGAEMGMDTQDVTVYVTDVNEDGTVTLLPASPMVGEEVTATLTDPEGMMDITWQWSKSTTKTGDFMDIDGAMSMAYTPVEADDGYYLMVKAMYTDAHGSQMEMATTDMAVTSVDEGPVQRYDGNDDGEIDIGELFVAIDAYFDEEISLTELFVVIDAYFAS